jgi:hypothetical protein
MEMLMKPDAEKREEALAKVEIPQNVSGFAFFAILLGGITAYWLWAILMTEQILPGIPNPFL